MNREIKFRAWDKKDNVMRSVYRIMYPEWHKGKHIRTNTHVQLFCSEVDYDLSSFKRPLGDVELMQYTGLKDKNEVEIFEGDICHTDYFKDNGWNTKAFNENQEVKFEDGAFQLGDFTTLYECTSNHEYALEVIGNIYENPELVK